MITKIAIITAVVSLIALVTSFMTKSSSLVVQARGLEWYEEFQHNQRSGAGMRGFKLSPVQINNITWVDCPLYSSSAHPVHEKNAQGSYRYVLYIYIVYC